MSGAEALPRATGDLMRDAQRLLDHGYLVAAVCTARVALEKRLCGRFVGNVPKRRGLIYVAMKLKEGHTITKGQKQATVDVAKKMNLIAHGDPVTAEKAAWILERTDWVLERVR